MPQFILYLSTLNDFCSATKLWFESMLARFVFKLDDAAGPWQTVWNLSAEVPTELRDAERPTAACFAFPKK